MKNIVTNLLFAASIFILSCGQNRDNKYVELQNPIIPGYFADPSVVEFEGKFYMYVTADPWGTEFLSCWESDDFKTGHFTNSTGLQKQTAHLLCQIQTMFGRHL